VADTASVLMAPSHCNIEDDVAALRIRLVSNVGLLTVFNSVYNCMFGISEKGIGADWRRLSQVRLQQTLDPSLEGGGGLCNFFFHGRTVLRKMRRKLGGVFVEN